MPLLYFGLAICFTFKLFADGIKFTNIHGWDLEGSGRLFETVLERIQLGTLIPHLLLMNQCFFNEMWRTLAINVIVIIYVIVLQVFMYKSRMANLRSIMRIAGKIDFQKTNNLDVAYWVYRYSHPYIRVLGPKKAMSFMNDINSPVSLEILSMNNSRAPRRFNIPINEGSPLRSPKKESSLTELNHYQESGEKHQVEVSSARKNLDMEKKFNRSGSKSLIHDDLASIKLELPLNGKEDSVKSENLFGSNSHFRKDGMFLDFASSPAWKQIEKSALEFNSNPLKVIEEKKDDSQLELDNARSREEEKVGIGHIYAKSDIGGELDKSHKIERFQIKKSTKEFELDGKPPSLLDIRTNKIISPIPLTLTKKNKSEGKFSLLSWKKMLQADKQATEHMEDNSKDILSVPKQTNADGDNQTFNMRESVYNNLIEKSDKLPDQEAQ